MCAFEALMEVALTFELILKVSGENRGVDQMSLGEVRCGQVRDVALLGLPLAEAKSLLTKLQSEIVAVQFRSLAAQRRACACCGTTSAISVT